MSIIDFSGSSDTLVFSKYDDLILSILCESRGELIPRPS